jgi:hypothetical protein
MNDLKDHTMSTPYQTSSTYFKTSASLPPAGGSGNPYLTKSANLGTQSIAPPYLTATKSPLLQSGGVQAMSAGGYPLGAATMSGFASSQNAPGGAGKRPLRMVCGDMIAWSFFTRTRHSMVQYRR